MKQSYRSKSPKLIALLVGAALLGLVSQNVLAAGTASGTSISNSASLTYSVGSVSQTPITSAAATFVVDNKVNLTVTKVLDNLTTTPGLANQVVAFTVTNNGNTAQRYALSAVQTSSVLTNPLTNVRIYLDVNANNAWDAGDTLYVNAGTFLDVAPDASIKVLIVADAPAVETNGQTAVYSLLATTVTAGTTTVTTATAGVDTAGVDVVFADAMSGIAGDSATVRDGQHAASATYTIATSALTVAKTVTLLCDPINGATNPKNIPGAVVQYAITISNAAGAASATLTSLSDALAASLAWEPKLISGAGATPSTTCTSAGGTQLSATTGFGVIGATGTTTSGYAAPGLAAQATTAGATAVGGAGGSVSINYATLTAGATIIPAGLAAGAMPANSAITVYFNAVVQ
jgi:hypothetical protein